MKANVFSLFLIAFFFLEPIYYCTTTVLKISPDYMAQTVFIMTVLSIMLFVFFKPKISYRIIGCFFGLIIFGVLFYSTSVFYGHKDKNYLTQFYSWLSLGNASVLVGMMLNGNNSQQYFSKMIKRIPYLIILLSLIISSRILLGTDTENGQFNDEFGLSYQCMAYYMALLFASSAYYVFVYTRQTNTKSKLKYALMLMMPLQIVMCAMSGGRGGFVLLVFYIAFFVWYLVKNKIIEKGMLSIIIIIVLIAVLVLANLLNIAESAGFQRSTDYEKDSRLGLWLTYVPIFLDAPIVGHGLGSVFYTWGFYSHNIVIDFLVEGGIIGAIIMVFIYGKIYFKLKNYSLDNPIAFFVLFFFLYQLVLNFFSLYWPSGQFNWLALGYVISYNDKSLTSKYL